MTTAKAETFQGGSDTHVQLVLFVQMEAYIHVMVSSQCSLKNKQ